jgi:hypothetical protein
MSEQQPEAALGQLCRTESLCFATLNNLMQNRIDWLLICSIKPFSNVGKYFKNIFTKKHGDLGSEWPIHMIVRGPCFQQPKTWKAFFAGKIHYSLVLIAEYIRQGVKNYKKENKHYGAN